MKLPELGQNGQECNIMTGNMEAHNMVIESLTEAVIQLMEKKPLEQINVSELCQRAGVSRMSFYRNFNSMHDILVRHLEHCTNDWWEEISKKPEPEFYRDFWPELLGIYRKNRALIMLLYENNASIVLKEHIFSCCMTLADGSMEDAYTRAALAGMIYGLVDEWIKRGMNEFPEQFSLTNMIQDALKEETR